MNLPGLDAVAAIIHGPSHQYTTFQVIQPPRPATCAEYGCPNYLNGWTSTVGADVVEQYRGLLRGRYSYAEVRGDDGRFTFTFPPGQECWAEHRMPWEGRERLIQRGGDWRGNPRGEMREFTRADDWVDAFATNQDRVATRLERG